MARKVKYVCVYGVFIVCGVFLLLIPSKMTRKQTYLQTHKRSEDLSNRHRKTSEYFNVETYYLKNDILTLIGRFKDSMLSHTLYVSGIAHILGRASVEKTAHLVSTERRVLPNRSVVRNVNCHLLVSGDNNEIKRVETLLETGPKVVTTPLEYTRMTINCTEFRLDRGYIMDSLTDTEKDFPIAFSILMYKDVEQSERLLRAIYRPQNLYCIHVDSKSSDNIFKAMSNIANCFENVFISSKRFNVEWGTMTVLEPDLLCMEELWNKSKTWKYFINLTGQEFPLRTNYELVQILKAYNGSNDVERIFPRNYYNERLKIAGSSPHGIVPVKGAVHVAVSRGYTDFVLHDHRAQDLLKWTRRTKVPDETFFSTLNHNPSLEVPGSYKGSPFNVTKQDRKPYLSRFKNWGDGRWTCKGHFVRSVCVFGVGDIPLLASRRELFANKFFLDYHHYGLDCLEELLYNRTRDEYFGKLVFDAEWYSKLKFVRNKVD